MPRPPAQSVQSPHGQTHAGIVDACRAAGHRPGRAGEAYAAFYREGIARAPATEAGLAPIVARLEEPGEHGVTTKFCQRLDDANRADALADTPTRSGPAPRAADRLPLGVLPHDARVRHLDVESVVIPMVGSTGRVSHTLCVSSQVGCAMGCRFCETAQMGLIRSLTPGEIVGQWYAATHALGDSERRSIDNIVFMGMGEPLDNLDSVLRAIEVLTGHMGPSVPMSNITVSTVGRVDGLRRLVDVVAQPGWRRLGLALSVNAPNDEVRSDIMPLNQRWGMGELREVMQDLVRVRGSRKLLFEYVLIPGVNDEERHAREIAQWLQPFVRTAERGHIGMLNVIPYNPRRDSPWPAPSEESVDAFCRWVGEHGVFVKRRKTKGRTSMAACGQLGTASIRRRRYIGATDEA